MESFEDAIEAPPGFEEGDQSQAQALDMSAALNAWLSDEGIAYQLNSSSSSLANDREDEEDEQKSRKRREEEKEARERARERLTPQRKKERAERAPPGFEDQPLEMKEEVKHSQNPSKSKAEPISNRTTQTSKKNESKLEEASTTSAGLGRGKQNNEKNRSQKPSIDTTKKANSGSNNAKGDSASTQNERGAGRGRGRGKPEKSSNLALFGNDDKEILGNIQAHKDIKSDGAECLTCCEPISAFAIGPCNHRALCANCILRLRVLYKDLKCPVCKEVQNEVVVSSEGQSSFISLIARASLQDVTSLARFDDPSLLASLTRAWTHFCPECPPALPAHKSIAALRAHAAKEHSLHWCDLCVEQGKQYLRDLPRYNKEQLRQHINDVKQHPRWYLLLALFHSFIHLYPILRIQFVVSAFCNKGFFDDEALFLHCTSVHENCFLCDRIGLRHQYFRDYSHLWRHFQQQHYICDDSHCRALKFIAFASPVELQAHRVAQHRDSMTKDEINEARRLQIDVTLTRPGSGAAGLRINSPDAPIISSVPSSSSSSGDAMSFSDHKPSSNDPLPPMIQGSVFAEHPLPSSDADHARRNKALRRSLVVALGDERARAFGALSGELRSGKISAAQFVNDMTNKFSQAESVFKELVALLPDEPRRRALIEAYTAKLHARRAQQGDFPLLAGDRPSVAASSSSGPTSYAPNASVGPSYRSLVSRGGGSSSWSSDVQQGLSSPNAFPSLPASQPSSRGGGNARGRSPGSSAWGNDADASLNNSAGNAGSSNSAGRGRGKKKQVLSAW